MFKDKGFGVSVLQRLCKTSIKKNLYYEIKDKVIEESFNGVKMNRKQARVKVYGLDSTAKVRARLIELLYDRVAYHKDKFISPILHHELTTLEVTPKGRVEAVAGRAHDDQVFSYLLAIYVWYDAQNIAEFGIKKNVLKTDEDIEIEDSNLTQEAAGVSIDLSNIQDPDNEIDPNFQNVHEFLKVNKNIKLQTDYKTQAYDNELEEFRMFLATNKDAKVAYEKKYHIEPDNNTILGIGYTELPYDIFGDATFDTMEEIQENRQKRRHGNLFNQFMSLD